MMNEHMHIWYHTSQHPAAATATPAAPAVVALAAAA